MSPRGGNGEKASYGRRVARTLKGLLLWDHARGSWQYDVMVVLILLFVFLTPVYWFDDKPDLQPLGPEAKGDHYRVRARMLRRYSADFRQEPRRAVERLFNDQLDHPFTIADIQEVRPEGGEKTVWYDVWLRGSE